MRAIIARMVCGKVGRRSRRHGSGLVGGLVGGLVPGHMRGLVDGMVRGMVGGMVGVVGWWAWWVGSPVIIPQTFVLIQRHQTRTSENI